MNLGGRGEKKKGGNKYNLPLQLSSIPSLSQNWSKGWNSTHQHSEPSPPSPPPKKKKRKRGMEEGKKKKKS
jgi:hypothetical protein